MKRFENKFLRKVLFLTAMFLHLVWLGTRAQGVLQVATKTIEKTIKTPTIHTLHINAEKADIELIAWDKQEISVVLELSSRHPDKAIATEDLGKSQYLADRNGRDYFLRNYIQLKEGESKPL